MTWLSLSLPLLLSLATLCVSAEDDKGPDLVTVFYKQNTMNAIRGSSVKLSCETRYYFYQCRLLHATWYRDSAELTDPSKYFTTVSETVAGQMRRRQVVTEILNLTPADSGQYQCKADCNSGADSAMGHIISVNVQG